MSFLDNWKAKRQERAKQMCLEAKDAMNSIESPYTVAKSALSEYEKAVKFRPGSAYKYAKKAYKAAITESEAARMHLKAVEVLEAQKRMDDEKVMMLDTQYRTSLAKGKMSKATSSARKMYELANSKPDPSSISVSLDESNLENGSVEVLITNRGNKAVVINSISCSCGTTELFSQKGMSEACQPGQQTKRHVTFDDDVSLGITVFVEYEDGFELNKIRRHFSLLKQV